MKVNRPNLPGFELQLDRAHKDEKLPQPLCIDREDEYVDFAVPPSEEQAREMCADCPILAACKFNARQVRPDWGVLGGIVWEHGRQYHWVRKLRRIS